LRGKALNSQGSLSFSVWSAYKTPDSKEQQDTTHTHITSLRGREEAPKKVLTPREGRKRRPGVVGRKGEKREELVSFPEVLFGGI